MPTDATDHLQDWIGRSEDVACVLDPWPVQALTASLELPGGTADPSETLPLLWHWLYFLDTAPRSRIGEDGHPERGEFMPPVSAPRRMFAGGRIECLAALRLGRPATQRRRIVKISEKIGATGQLTFIVVGYDHWQDDVLCVREQRDFVYLHSPPAPQASQTAELAPALLPCAPWELAVIPDPVLLMRFSGLTFNGHRIHYDADYARDVEGYSERVVHGPLTAMLLAELARLGSGRPLKKFEFRARSPLLVNSPIGLRGWPDNQGGSELHAYDNAGRLAMSAGAHTVS